MSEIKTEFQNFHWLDIGDPTTDSLNEIARKYELHPTSVADCMQPEHLPKFEVINDVGFIVLRAFDPEAPKDADTVQELTRKVAIFYSKRFVITIHRRKHHLLMQNLVEKWSKRASSEPNLTPERLLADLALEVVRSYQGPVMECLGNLEVFEMEIFGTGTHRKFRLSKGYYLKRKASVYRRMLRSTLEPVNKMTANAEKKMAPHFQNVKDEVEGLFFYVDEITESISSLLNLHISLQSQKTNEASRRTNEVMRVLTIFSCFFLPINFIASIYGMNFENLPETKWPYGYYFALSVMASISIIIFVWFRRKGWLKGSR